MNDAVLLSKMDIKNIYNEYFISYKHKTCILILPCSKQRIKKCDFVRYPLK